MVFSKVEGFLCFAEACGLLFLQQHSTGPKDQQLGDAGASESQFYEPDEFQEKHRELTERTLKKPRDLPQFHPKNSPSFPGLFFFFFFLSPPNTKTKNKAKNKTKNKKTEGRMSVERTTDEADHNVLSNGITIGIADEAS